MVRLTLTFPSSVLLRPVNIEIGLPFGFCPAKPPWRAIWALHCAMSDGSMFFETLNAGELIDKMGFALIAPSLGNGFFLNSIYEKQGDFLNEIFFNLPQILPLSSSRDMNSVLGISMGAFGAMRLALASGNYKNAVMISGVFNPQIEPSAEMVKNRAQRAIHSALRGAMGSLLLDSSGKVLPEADIEELLDASAEGMPDMHFYCGLQDYLSLPQTKFYERLCASRNCQCTCEWTPGAHDSKYWRNAFKAAVEKIFA